MVFFRIFSRRINLKINQIPSYEIIRRTERFRKNKNVRKIISVRALTKKWDFWVFSLSRIYFFSSILLYLVLCDFVCICVIRILSSSSSSINSYSRIQIFIMYKRREFPRYRFIFIVGQLFWQSAFYPFCARNVLFTFYFYVLKFHFLW